MNKMMAGCLVVLLCGCATTMSYDEIVRTAEETNVADGVSRQEAVVLAQNYLIENGLDMKHSVYRVGPVERAGEEWIVRFNAGVARGASQTRRFDFVEPIQIKVDARTGAVSL